MCFFLLLNWARLPASTSFFPKLFLQGHPSFYIVFHILCLLVAKTGWGSKVGLEQMRRGCMRAPRVTVVLTEGAAHGRKDLRPWERDAHSTQIRLARDKGDLWGALVVCCHKMLCRLTLPCSELSKVPLCNLEQEVQHTKWGCLRQTRALLWVLWPGRNLGASLLVQSSTNVLWPKLCSAQPQLLSFSWNLKAGAPSSWVGTAVWGKGCSSVLLCPAAQTAGRSRRKGTKSPIPLCSTTWAGGAQVPWLWWQRGHSGDCVPQTNDLTPSSLSSCSEQKSAERKAKSDLQSIFIKSQILSVQLHKQYFCELKITSC